MKSKISNQFFSNYLIIFLLTLTATFLGFVMVSFASSFIQSDLVKNQYTAASIMEDDYTQIDTADVVENGGGVQVIDAEYSIVLSDGIDTIGKNQLSAGEFTSFLTEAHNLSYHYDIVYNPENEFWLIVTFPTSLRVDFSFVYNRQAASQDFARVRFVLIITAVVYLLILALFSLLYSRAAASRITIPLRKLSDGTRLLREGEYSTRVELNLKNEFAELQTTFNEMAERIEHEMTLRKKSESDRKRLILDISHDLKNPLSSIQGYSELCLNKQDLGRPEQNQYLQIIHQNSKRANLLLTELFELSQMDSPDFTMSTKKTDLCEYLRLECGKLISQLDAAGFSYDFDIPDKCIYVMMDVRRFTRILQNLAENAIRYNPKGTTISVSLKEQSGIAVICFNDDGLGIPEPLAEDIFKPFVRTDKSRSSQTGGSGLGLSIAKKIAQAHKGDLKLSPGTDKGSKFIITISII